MGYSGRDYDSAFGFRGGWRDGFGTYDTGFQGRGTWNGENAWNGESGWGRTGYDAGYRGYGYGSQGYDSGFRNRWETDNGDPFGDRSNRTPIRSMRGRFSSRYDQGFDRGSMNRGFMGGSMNDYGRDYYSANPMGYEPYRGSWNRMNDQTRRGRYDTGWF